MGPITQAFLLIVLLAIAVGFFLVYHASQKKAAEDAAASRTSPHDASENLEQELKKHLSGDARHVNSLTKKISHLVDKEVEKKLVVKTNEISGQYKRIIDEKDKAFELVETQFKTVSEQYQKLDSTFKELGEEKKQTEEVVRSMADGVIMVNKKGEVILMNPAAEKMLGVKKEEKIGQSVLNDLKEEHLVSLSQEATGEKSQKEIVIQSQNDQTQKVLRASNAVIESEDGKTVGFVSVLSDVTKQKELETLKNSFLANVSHDLRTPLSCIQGALELLCDQSAHQLPPSQAKVAGIALDNIRRLSRLINDLLDVSKLEAKKFTILPAPFQLDQLIQSLANEFSVWGKGKGIAIVAKIEGPLEFVGDQDRLGQVLTNLMGNAMKFTPSGGSVTIEAKHTSPEKIEVRVTDTGPGIAKKDFTKIFEKFSQLDTPKLRGVSGTGLGLTIAKEIVELHGGRIWIESQEGKGSCFAFELPVKR